MGVFCTFLFGYCLVSNTLPFTHYFVNTLSELDLVCSSLQQILENDPLIPRPVIHTVDVTDRSKRIELVENAVETAGQWIEGNQEKDPNLDKSNSDLEDLCHGMEQVSHEPCYWHGNALFQ